MNEQPVPFEVRDLRVEVGASALALPRVARRRPPLRAPLERRAARLLERGFERLARLYAATDRERRVGALMLALVPDDPHAQLAFHARQFRRSDRLTELDGKTPAADKRERDER